MDGRLYVVFSNTGGGGRGFLVLVSTLRMLHRWDVLQSSVLLLLTVLMIRRPRRAFYYLRQFFILFSPPPVI